MPFDVAQKEKEAESSWRIKNQIKRREARDSGIPYEWARSKFVCEQILTIQSMRSRLLPRSSEAEPQKQEESYVDERQAPEKAGRQAMDKRIDRVISKQSQRPTHLVVMK